MQKIAKDNGISNINIVPAHKKIAYGIEKKETTQPGQEGEQKGDTRKISDSQQPHNYLWVILVGVAAAWLIRRAVRARAEGKQKEKPGQTDPQPAPAAEPQPVIEQPATQTEQAAKVEPATAEDLGKEQKAAPAEEAKGKILKNIAEIWSLVETIDGYIAKVNAIKKEFPDDKQITALVSEIIIKVKQANQDIKGLREKIGGQKPEEIQKELLQLQNNAYKSLCSAENVDLAS